MKVTNTYKHRTDGVTELSITKRDGSIHLCLIDTADFEEISKHTWTVSSTGYVSRGYRENGEKITVALHRLLMEQIPEGQVVDHINGNPCDNRRSNIRLATVMQNMHNRRMITNKEVKVKGIGIHRIREYEYVRATIKDNGKNHYGSWSIAKHGKDQAIELATHWIKTKRIELHGSFARHA